MINLRYHIVSLTAVFLAIGIGLTLGSTFLDRATVENLNGQLTSLEDRLGDREQQIQELEGRVDAFAATQDALDEQGRALLTDRLTEVPVMVFASEGTDEDDVQGAVQALVAAGAQVQGTLTITERFRLDDDSAISDLAAVVGDDSTDPSRLRRVTIAALGGDLRTRQLLGVPDATSGAPGADDPAAPTPETDPATGDGTGDPAAGPTADPTDSTTTDAATTDTGTTDTGATDLALVDDLVAAGFLSFEPVAGGAESPEFPAGIRLVIIGGSSSVPDDLVIEPLLERMARATTTPVLAVVSSGLSGDGQVADAVLVIRQSDDLRDLVSTVDSVEHFAGQAAVVLALADLGDGIVGHYGLGEGASQLLPPLQPT